MMAIRPAGPVSRLRSLADAEVRPWFWGILAVAMAAVLAVRGWDAHRRNAEVTAEVQRAEADIERIRSDRDRLGAELRAIREDPVYVESVLRWMQAAEGSRR